VIAPVSSPPVPAQGQGSGAGEADSASGFDAMLAALIGMPGSGLAGLLAQLTEQVDVPAATGDTLGNMVAQATVDAAAVRTATLPVAVTDGNAAEVTEAIDAPTVVTDGTETTETTETTEADATETDAEGTELEPAEVEPEIDHKPLPSVAADRAVEATGKERETEAPKVVHRHEPAPETVTPDHTQAIEAPAAPAAPAPEAIEAPTTLPAPDRPVAMHRVANAIQDALGHIRQRADGTYRLAIRLDPPELGHVRVDLIASGDDIHLQLHTETSGAHNALNARHEGIERALQAEGFSLGSFDVQTGQPDERRQEANTTNGNGLPLEETEEADAADQGLRL
jgi:flagellar hook-length control protein FliK